MAFPTTPTNGQQATVNGIVYSYDSDTNSWSRIQTTLPILSIVTDTFSGDGLTTAFTLSTSPYAKEFITINIDGVLQQKSAYSILNNVVTLTGTPIVGSIIEIKTTTSSPTSILTGLVFDSFTGDGSTTEYTLSIAPTTKNFTLVSVGGVVQQKSTYSTSSNTLTFTTAPPNTAPIEVTTFGPAITSTQAAGSNTQIQFNNDNVLTGSSNLTFDSSTSTFATGNITLANAVASGNVTASYFIGDGSQLTNVPTAGVVTTNAQPNITSVGTLTGLTVAGTTTLQLAADILTLKTGATGVVTHDLSAGGVFYHTAPAANFTANFTNVPVTDSRVFLATILVTQGASAYLPTAVQIEGSAYTIKWSGGTAPTANANKIDIISFSLLRTSASWTVLGSSSNYS